MKLFLKILVAVIALGLTISAGYFSVLGLTKMFAGAFIGTAIVCTFAEAGKVIIASVLHQFKDKLKWIHKGLLTLGLTVLMEITSVGVYGYLTNGFQQTMDGLKIIDQQTEIIEMKKSRFQTQLDDYSTEKTQLATSISELSKGLANNVIQYKDKETGEIITTTSSATRKILQTQLDDFKEQRNNVSLKIEALTDSVTVLDLQIIDLSVNNEAAAEIGPLKFIAEITGYEMHTVVNVITLLLVAVIDPLAILLVIVFNRIIINDEEDIEAIAEEILEEDEEQEPNEALKEAARKFNEGQPEPKTIEEHINQINIMDTIEWTPEEEEWKKTLHNKLHRETEQVNEEPKSIVTNLAIEKQPHIEGKPIHEQPKTNEDEFYGEKSKKGKSNRIG